MPSSYSSPSLSFSLSLSLSLFSIIVSILITFYLDNRKEKEDKSGREREGG
jgi:hypothetical protein